MYCTGVGTPTPGKGAMNAREVRAINDEYNRLEGTVTGEVMATLWDRASNRHYVTRCVVIDLGRRPPVTPYDLTSEDRSLMRLRTGVINKTTSIRSTEAPDTLCERLHAWMKNAGAVTNHQAAQALNVPAEQAKHLLTSNTRLFRPWKKIAGQSYFIAI